jgi:hypothetical protein
MNDREQPWCYGLRRTMALYPFLEDPPWRHDHESLLSSCSF